MLDVQKIKNPIWPRSDSQRDPAVLPVDGGYMMFYTRNSNLGASNEGAWLNDENWSIARVFTPDFCTFTGDMDITPKGFASPGDPVRWHGRLILPFQSYPIQPNRLCYSVTTDEGHTWGAPIFFLDDARQLPWNKDRRLIDPSFAVNGDTLHCYFVGSQGITGGPRMNLLGHASTHDPELQDWTIHSVSEPLIGISERAPDGVENIMVIRVGDSWMMIFSEGLNEQHLAYGVSKDLCSWKRAGEIELPTQWWMAHRHGAPFIWRENDRWLMLLMGEEAVPPHLARIGLLHSTDAIHWTLCAEHPRLDQMKNRDFWKRPPRN